MKRETKIILVFIGVLVIFAAGFWWSNSSSEAENIVTQTLKKDTLDQERQLVTIQVDSLMLLVAQLHERNTSVFDYEDEGDELVFRCNEGQHSAFNRLFLNEASLKSFANLQQTGLTIKLKNYAFSAPIVKENRRRYVTLPAEIVQSMFLSIEP